MLTAELPHSTDTNERRPKYDPPIIMSLGSVQEVTRGPFPSWEETAAVAITTSAVTWYVQGIMSELGKRTVEVAPKAYRGISCRLKFRGRGSKALVQAAAVEVQFDGEATTVVLTKELPDEARLMLLDLDLTSERLRGKFLGWDDAAGEWVPISIPRRSRWGRRCGHVLAKYVHAVGLA